MKSEFFLQLPLILGGQMAKEGWGEGGDWVDTYLQTDDMSCWLSSKWNKLTVYIFGHVVLKMWPAKKARMRIRRW